MKARLSILVLAIALFASHHANAQTEPVLTPTPAPIVKGATQVTIKTSVTKAKYEEMLAKLKGGDMSIDFALLRLAYTETKDYSPYGGSELRSKMSRAYRENKFKDSVDAANEMLKKNYVDMTAHYWASLAHNALRNHKESETHAAILRKLLAAIQENDGLSAKTAMISIGISEQYFVMDSLGFERKSKALLQDEGSVFDVHTATNEETQETRKFYFNIDKVFGKF